MAHLFNALFVPKNKLRPIIREIAAEEDLDEKWLNDGVKGFFSPENDFGPFMELSHLKIFSADPQYLLAMKCLAMRLGPEFSDEDNIRFLLRLLDIETYNEALKVIQKYYPLKNFPPKSFYALGEILAGKD